MNNNRLLNNLPYKKLSTIHHFLWHSRPGDFFVIFYQASNTVYADCDNVQSSTVADATYLCRRVYQFDILSALKHIVPAFGINEHFQF